MALPFLRKHPSLVLGTTGPLSLGPQLILGPAEISTHKHIMGVTGQGKSKLMASIFLQLQAQKLGCAIIDPHSDLALDVLSGLEGSGVLDSTLSKQRIMFIDFSREDAFLPFNVLNQPGRDAHAIARDVVEAFTRAWPALGKGAAPQFENIMLAALVVLIDNRLPLTALPGLLTDGAYRSFLLTQVKDPEIVKFFRSRFDRWGRDAALMIESTLRRVFLLTFTPALRYTLGQRENALNFRKIMDDGVCLVVSLGGLDEQTQRFLGCLLTVGFESASLSRANLPEEERRQYHLLLDEFSMFSAQSEEALARILSLARKYGLFLTMAHQTWSQVSGRLHGALQNSTEIAFRLGRSDAELTAPLFGHFEPSRIKHMLPDPAQAERSHPVFLSLQEQMESWTRSLETLQPRHAFVSIGRKTAKVKTLTIHNFGVSRERLTQLTNRYARMLMIPREDVIVQLDYPAPSPSTSRLTPIG